MFICRVFSGRGAALRVGKKRFGSQRDRSGRSALPSLGGWTGSAASCPRLQHGISKPHAQGDKKTHVAPKKSSGGVDSAEQRAAGESPCSCLAGGFQNLQTPIKSLSTLQYSDCPLSNGGLKGFLPPAVRRGDGCAVASQHCSCEAVVLSSSRDHERFRITPLLFQKGSSQLFLKEMRGKILTGRSLL